MRTRLSRFALSLLAAVTMATACDTETDLPDDPADFDRVANAGAHCGDPSGGEGGEEGEGQPGGESSGATCVIGCVAYEGKERAPLFDCEFIDAGESLEGQDPTYDPNGAVCIDAAASGTEYLFYEVGAHVDLVGSVAHGHCRGDGTWEQNATGTYGEGL